MYLSRIWKELLRLCGLSIRQTQSVSAVSFIAARFVPVFNGKSLMGRSGAGHESETRE